MNLEVGQILTNEDLVNLMGSEKQRENYRNKRKLQKKTKESLLKQLDRYCKYLEYSEGNAKRYEIIEVFEKCKDKKDNRKGNSGGANNSIYQDDFMNMMIYNLYNYPDRCKLLSKSYLCKMANLVNSNYTTCKRNIKELSTILEINEDEVYSFYHDNNEKLKGIAERGLSSCRKKSILTYNSVTVLAKKELIYKYNELGEPIIRGNKPVYEIIYKHKVADENELEIILDVEHKVKEEMFGDKNKCNRNIFLSGKWNEYTKNIKREIKERDLNISYYYEAYELNWIKSNIEELYKKIENKYDNFSNSINKKYVKSTEQTINSNFNSASKEMYKREEYVENQFKLSKTLIDKNTKYLGNDDELRKMAKIKEENK